MVVATPKRRASQPQSLADVLHKLGDVSIDRIGLPLGTATEEDVIKHLDGDDKRIYELVDGFLVEKDMGMRESIIASQVCRYLGNYLDDRDLGVPFTADGPIRIRKGRIRFPDTGFVSWDRLPGGVIPEDAILDAVPDLVVEVISKGNTPREMELKLKDYFRRGVQLAWYIYPKTETAVVYTSPQSGKPVDKDGALEGGKLLPGFRLPLKKLFAKLRRKS
jgi:Uma2 family endonuclease